ncbi:hypothetical protein MPLSOD_40242 [Mesorhizobium sp. SOD10]|nr:hypothetical protein MPLSOD_40242 [Mesorhizobium sp. SOD10]
MTSILVRKTDGIWGEWHGSLVVQQVVGSYTAVYGDGRQIETPCDPYPIDVQMNGDNIRGLYDSGIWSVAEIEAVGGRIALPFEVPEGKQAVGSPTYVEIDGVVQQVYDIEDIPPPPEPPRAEEKAGAMLANFDISISELKSALGLGV